MHVLQLQEVIASNAQLQSNINNMQSLILQEKQQVQSLTTQLQRYTTEVDRLSQYESRSMELEGELQDCKTRLEELTATTHSQQQMAAECMYIHQWLEQRERAPAPATGRVRW
jgi:septal ring factor EnvC (AmiA/AmiB activator)